MTLRRNLSQDIHSLIHQPLYSELHSAYFDGVNNFLAFSEFEVIPEGEPGFIAFEGVFESSNMWLTTLKSAMVGEESKRILFYNGSLYVGSKVVSTIDDEHFADISDGSYRFILIFRDSDNQWYVSLDGHIISTVKGKSSISIRSDSWGCQYSGGTSVPYLRGQCANVNLNNKRRYRLDEAWSDYPVANDSVGNENGTYMNFQAADVRT